MFVEGQGGIIGSMTICKSWDATHCTAGYDTIADRALSQWLTSGADHC
jgi:hypothetical protein